MTMQNKKRRASTFVVWTVCLFIFVALYLASLGPVNRLYVKNRISRPTYELLADTVYAPVHWVEINTDLFYNNPLGRAYGRYLEWCVTS